MGQTPELRRASRNSTSENEALIGLAGRPAQNGSSLLKFSFLEAGAGRMKASSHHIYTRSLGHFQVGRYRYRSLVEGLQTL